MANFADNMVLLVSVDTIKSLGVLDRNLSEQNIAPVIKFVQDDTIQNLIGSRLYERLLFLVDNDSICDEGNECYLELLNGYLKWILAWQVRAQCNLVFHSQLRNAGVINMVDSSFTPISYSDMKKNKADISDMADSYIEMLKRYLSCNCGCFPELKGIDEWWQISPDIKNVTNSPIYFPSRRGCGCKTCN